MSVFPECRYSQKYVLLFTYKLPPRPSAIYNQRTCVDVSVTSVILTFPVITVRSCYGLSTYLFVSSDEIAVHSTKYVPAYIYIPIYPSCLPQTRFPLYPHYPNIRFLPPPARDHRQRTRGRGCDAIVVALSEPLLDPDVSITFRKYPHFPPHQHLYKNNVPAYTRVPEISNPDEKIVRAVRHTVPSITTV
jgi:hypothetical protein